jgi:hypothetical protein
MIRFPYEVSNGFVGPFYDQKVLNPIAAHSYSKLEDAKEACTGLTTCESIFFE